jgi:uncharacterized protein YndB with AHSA1/START domain
MVELVSSERSGRTEARALSGEKQLPRVEINASNRGPEMSASDRRDEADILSGLDVKTYCFSYEMTIDKPAQAVWRHMLNYRKWNPAHIGAKVTRLTGDENEEGEIILESKKSGEGYAAPIIIETVKIIPNEKIVWALYQPEDGAASEIGFVDFSLQETGDKTRFTYRSYGWGRSSLIGNDPKAFRDSVMKALDEQLPALKEFVERRE